jgi:hypothetical protein
MVSPARWGSGMVSRAGCPLLGASVRVCLAGCLIACGASSSASFLPTVEFGVSLRQRGQADPSALHDARERLDIVAMASLRFRALNPAADLPRLGELLPETWLAPCDDDDVICLQEAAEAERELAAALGELQ